MENYTFNTLSIKNIPELNKLFKAAFNKDPKENLFQWKYFNNPSGHAILAGAFYKNELVSSGAMIPEKVSVHGKEKSVYKCTDLMTHPNHQMKGLSKKINELLIQKTKEMNTLFSYTLCSKISTRSFIKNNWIFLEEVINFFKPYPLLKVSIMLKKINIESFELHDMTENLLDKYKFKQDSTKIMVKKDPYYLKWRTSNPNFSYKIIYSYNSSKEVNGYLIYSNSSNNLLNIIDMESSTNSKETINKLLNYAEYIAVKEKSKGILIMTIKNTPLYHFIKSKKYLSNPFDKGPLKTILDFDIYLYDKAQIHIKDSSNWDLYGLSYDDI